MTSVPQFYLHSDGNFLYVSHPPLTEEQFLYETVGWLTGTQVDGIICHMFTVGDCSPLFPHDYAAAQTVFPDKAMSVFTWKGIRNLQALLQFPRDPWALAIEQSHAEGKPFWGAMRFNDGHSGQHGMRSQFGIDHPEYRLGERCANDNHDPDPDGHIPPCRHLDFSIPAVRQHQLRLVEELCGRYDVDGFELDFTRDCGHNFPHNLPEPGATILSEHVRQIGELLDRIGTQRGRKIDFGARVPGTLAACHDADLDVDHWVAEGLVDVLTPTVYYDTACDLPFDSFVDLARDRNCLVYASVTEGVGPGRFRPPPAEAVRGAALNAWRQGVAGINLFNFHHHQIANRLQDMTLLGELGSVDPLARKDKLYMLAEIGVPSQSRFFGKSYQSAHPHQLPAELHNAGDSLLLSLPVGDDLELARQERVLATLDLKLDFCHLTGDEQLQLTINGIDIPLHEGHVNVGQQYPWNWNGHFGHLEIGLDLLPRDCIQQGENEFTLTLHKRPADILQPLALYSLRLEVRYQALPMGLG